MTNNYDGATHPTNEHTFKNFDEVAKYIDETADKAEKDNQLSVELSLMVPIAKQLALAVHQVAELGRINAAILGEIKRITNQVNNLDKAFNKHLFEESRIRGH